MSCPAGTLRFSLDRTNTEAVQWAKTRAARLVTEVTAEARAAIRVVVERAFVEGLPPREAARLIRSIVGLTERDALAVMNRQVALMARGVSPSRAQLMAERYAGTLHRRRALVIARTETMAASNEGQQQLWNQAVRAGHLEATLRKEWIVTDDERTCDVCMPLEGTTVPLQEPFPDFGNPPAHPQCRCTIGVAAEAPRRRA